MRQRCVGVGKAATNFRQVTKISQTALLRAVRNSRNPHSQSVAPILSS
jgi:hypothetical protein